VFVGLRGALSRFYANDGFFLAAGLAFVFLICVIPAALLGVSVLGFVLSTEQAAEEVVGQLARNFPVYRLEISLGMLRIVNTRNVSGLVGTAVLLFFSTSLFGATRLVMHRMLGIRGTHNPFRNLMVDAAMALLLGPLLLVAAAVTWSVRWVEQLVRAPGGWIDNVSLGLSLGLSVAMFFLGYRYVAARRVRTGAALTGAVLASLLWEGAKQLFRLYVRRFGLYDQIYGPLSVLVVFVMFVYYSAVVFVFGAAYVAALDARRR